MGEFKGFEIFLWIFSLDLNICIEKLLEIVKIVNVIVLYLVVKIEVVCYICVDMDILCIILFIYVLLIKESNIFNLLMFFFGSLLILKVIVVFYVFVVFF